jgi:hypothetical protein
MDVGFGGEDRKGFMLGSIDSDATPVVVGCRAWFRGFLANWPAAPGCA